MSGTDMIAIGFIIAWIIAGLAILVGWIMNIITLISVETYETTTQIAVGCIGIFVAPVGALLYYIAG